MEDALGYAGKTAVVTGAASGMGAATAQILVDLGAEVVGIDINPTAVPVKVSLQVDLRGVQELTGAVASRARPDR